MAKTKPTKRTVERAKVRAKKKSETPPPPQQVAPWVIPELVRERVWNHLPVFFEALNELHTEQVKTNTLLTEIRDALKE